MTNDDYQATGINTFEKLEDLLKARRDMLQTLINTVDTSGHKVIAYGALKAARLHFDKAVLDELQEILESHKAVGLLEKSNESTKPKMTDEQKELGKSFHNALVDMQSYVILYLKQNGVGRYDAMANNAYILGKKLLAEWKNQFDDD